VLGSEKEYGIIALGSSTEAYLILKEGLTLTRDLLKIMLRYRFPVEIGTKSTLILRDLDILKEIDENAILPLDLQERLKRGVIISCSISTLDDEVARLLEPGAPRPQERLDTMKGCKENGFLTGIIFIPVLQCLSDSEEDLDTMIRTAKAYGADFVFIGGLTLFGDGPDDCKTLYSRFLEKHYPELVLKYKRLYRVFFYPNKEYKAKLTATAKRLCKKHGIRHSSV